MLTYERIEEMGLTLFQKKPIEIRNKMLKKSDDDELLCFFQIMDAHQFPLFFSTDTIIHTFKRIPNNEIFQVLNYLNPHEIPFFFTRKTIRDKIICMNQDHFMCDFEEYKSVLFLLLDLKYISIHDIYLKMNIRHVSISMISRFSRDPLYKLLFHDYHQWTRLILSNRLQLPSELIHHIFSFL